MIMFGWCSGMRALLGSPVGRGACTPSCRRGDRLFGVSPPTIGGVAPGVLRRVCLRCVLGFSLRTRGFVGLVLVVTGAAGGWAPSVVALSPSVAGSAPPFAIVSIAFFKFLIAAFLGLFLRRWMLSIHSCATSLLCCCSVSVGNWQCCGKRSYEADVLYALVSGI